jgi:hypothetical protein
MLIFFWRYNLRDSCRLHFCSCWLTNRIFMQLVYMFISHPQPKCHLPSTGLRKNILRFHSAYHIEARCVFPPPPPPPLSAYICVHVYVMFEWYLNVGTLCPVITDTFCLPRRFIALKRLCFSVLLFPRVFTCNMPDGRSFTFTPE